MCEIANGLKRKLELEINSTTAQAIQFGVHTGVLQAKNSYELHVQLCPKCKPDKPWETYNVSP
jgi:hypothetical protein